MRVLLFIFIVLLFNVTSAFSQQEIEDYFSEDGSDMWYPKNENNTVDFRDSTIFVLDSTLSFSYDDDNLDSTLIRKYVARERNDFGNIEIEEHSKLFNDEEWRIRAIDSILYYDGVNIFEKYSFVLYDIDSGLEWAGYSLFAENGNRLESASRWSDDRFTRTYWSYDDENRRVLVVSEICDIDTINCRNRHLNEYFYEDDLLTSDIASKWDTIEQEWLATTKWEYEYNEESLKIRAIKYFWDVELSAWMSDYKYNFEYDERENIIQSVKEEWIVDSSLWRKSRKIDLGYTSFDRMTYIHTYNWDNDLEVWQNRNQYLWDFYSFESLYRYHRRKWVDSAWVNVEEVILYYTDVDRESYSLRSTWEDDTWKPYESKVSFWSELEVVSIPDLQNKGINVYPNPTNGIIHIDFDKSTVNPDVISVYNINGQLLLQKTNPEENLQIDLTPYPSGIFFIRIGDRVVKVMR